MCYIYGTANDGLGYDNGHQYRTWPIVIAPTYFNTNTQKYVYVAIPKNQTVGTTAMVVFPSEQLDIYGKNASDEQIGSTDYFFIWLQGIVSEVRENDSTLERQWAQNINYGLLDTDQARDAKTDDTSWYSYSNLTEIVTFLKEIVMNVGSSFRNLFLGGKELTSVATDNTTPADSTTAIVTPAYSSGRYLSKIDPDAAHGLIDFLAGLTTGNFQHGSTGASIDSDGNAEFASAYIRGLVQAAKIITDYANSSDFFKGQLGGSGWGIYKDSNGHSTMELDNLIVRMKAVFAELEIRKLSYIGGDYIFSSAGSMICKVEYLDSSGNVVAHTKLHTLVDGDGNLITQGDNPVVWNEDVELDPEDIAKFRCYVYADDGSTRTMNWWEVGDQARCQSFNIKEGVHKNATNKFYWRRVVGIGTAELEDGNVYNYVDLSNSDYAGKAQNEDTEGGEKHWRVMHPQQGDVDKDGQQLSWVDTMGYPAPGDAIVQLGNVFNPQRQNAIEIVVEGDNAPAIIEYKGINDYRLSTHRRTVLSPNGDEFYAKSFTLVTADEVTPIPRDRGEWESSKTYYYYDRVSWNGSLWLCLNQSTEGIVNSEPSDNNDDWLKQVSGGSQGTPGQSTPLMVCLPNPLNIEADNDGLAVDNWSEDIRVRVYYNGIQQTPLTVSATIDNTSLTTRIDGNVGVVTISGTQGSPVPNAAVNVTATFANPSGGTSITSYGTFTISPSKNGTNGSNGKTLGQVVISPSPYYIEADDSGNPYRNTDDNIDVMVLNPDTGLGLPINGITFNGYSSWSNYGDRFRLWLDEYYDDSNGYHASIGIFWAQSLQVVDEKVRIQISYENGAQEQLYANAIISVQPNRAGVSGTSPLSIQCTPNVLYIPVDNSSDLTTREVNETVNVKLFDGSQTGTISEIRSVEDASGNDYLSLSYGMNQDGTAYVRVHIDNDTTFDGDSWVAITLIDSSGNEVSGGFAVVRNINGSNGTNGRGISRIETTYGISDSYDDVPQSWSQTQPPVGERQILWTRMIIYYTDGTHSDPIYTIAYQGGDGDNGTSVDIKGSAVGHSIDVSGITSTGIWLLDEFGTDHRSYVLNVTSFSESTMDYTASIPENGDGYIVESTGHLWVATEGAWVDAGRIKGDDGAPAYLHYAWANSEDGSQNFTTNKAVGSEYHYIGICTDSIQADPGSEERPVENAWTLYDWNPIGEGNKGTTILGEALDYVNDQKMSIGGADFGTRNRTKPYLLDLNNYAFDDDAGEFYRSDGNGVGHKLVYFWTSRSGSTTINHVSFADPEEADAWLINGMLYSSIDQRWMNLGQYTGDSAYLHLAWANSSDGSDGFTTEKGAADDYAYMGICYDNDVNDPGSPQRPVDDAWTLYDWQRVRGISPAEIILNSDYAVADTDENGRITNLNMVSGLPTSVRFFADGVNVKLSSWSSATITYIFKDIPSVTYNIGSKNPTFRTEAGVKVTGRTWSSTSDSVSLTWGYTQDNGVDPILNLRQIKFTVSASHSDISYTAEKTIPFILNMKGESSKFRVQYSADKGVSDSWHYGYNDGTNHIGSEPDKWMRISDDGGATWGTPIKIVANEMNVRGEAYFHEATAPSKPSPWDDSHVGLVDTIGTKKSVVVQWTGSARTDTEATIGDCYILRDETSDANGHLFIATENGWTDIGQVAGANGKDAIVATTDPAQLIVTQEEAGIAPPSPTTRVIVVEGDNVVPISNFTIGEGYIPDTDAYNCNATIDNTTKTVRVQIRTTGSTITVDGISYPTYYSNGWVKIPVKYKSYSAKLVFNWYANLLGTWKQTIKGDVNTMLANRVRYVEDDNGDIVLLSNDGKFILSSKELSALLTEYHDDVFITEASLDMTAYELKTKVRNNEGNIAQLNITAKNISTRVESLNNQYSDISQTAQKIVSTVQSLPIGAANLFNFSECKFSGSGLGKAIPYIQGYGFECNTNHTRLANLGTNGIGGDFVVTCEMRMGGDSPSTTSVHVDICDKLSKEGELRNITTSWMPQVFTFEDLDSPHFAGSYNGFMDFEGAISDVNRLQIRNLKIERGQVPTAFCISDKDANAFNSNDILSFTENPLLTVESSRYKGYKVYKLSSANYPSTEANMFYASKSNGYLGVGKVFTLSFYAKSSVNGTVFGNYFYGNLDTQNRNNPVDGTIGGDHTDIANGGMTALNRFDGGTFIKLTTAWKRYTIHWFNQNQGDRNIEFGRLNADWSPAADVYVTGIEFREGYWTDEQMNSQSMIRQTANEIEMRVNDTGINIEDGSITLNADKTTIVGDLSLRDTNQGLVLYDGGNTERVTVKPETLGNLDDYQFGTRIITAADAIVVNGVVSFEAIVLGQATAGGTFQISQLRLTKNNDFTLSRSMSYSYTIKNNGTTLVTKTGSLSSSGSYWYLDVSSGNISNTGDLTLTLTLTNVSASYASFRAHVIGNITGVGLNKIGKDGAMFANDRTHYNWFGVDQTQFQQGATTLRISENGIFRNGMDIGSYTKVSVVSTSGSNVEPVATNVYNWHADLSMGVILVNTNATFNIYLPYCYNCVGKIYYVKRLMGTVNVFMDGSGSGGRFLVPSDSDTAVASMLLGSRATMFVSAGGYWLEFDCS